MTKVRKTFRLDKETTDMMDTLIVFISSEKNLKLDRTKLIELLVSERYERLLKESQLGSE